jgi:glucose/arabinose dehydrogenase
MRRTIASCAVALLCAAMGRPVGLAIDRSGGLLVADDVGNTVWRVR